MTNSNLVGLITGRSAGFSPLNRDRAPAIQTIHFACRRDIRAIRTIPKSRSQLLAQRDLGRAR